MSLSPQPSFDLNLDASINDDNEEVDSQNVVARPSAAVAANESNFNLVNSDFNLASVSMPFILFYFEFCDFFSSFRLFVCL